MDPKKTAEKLNIPPEKIDFTLSDKELDKVSGGQASQCAEIGTFVHECTKTGIATGCAEIGYSNPECTKTGV